MTSPHRETQDATRISHSALFRRIETFLVDFRPVLAHLQKTFGSYVLSEALAEIDEILREMKEKT